MANKRSGAQRRAVAKAAMRQAEAEGLHQREPVQESRGSKVSGLQPELADVLRAIESLYVDQMKPYGRLLRKRIAENTDVSEHARTGKLPEVDVQHLRALCLDCDELVMTHEACGDWSVTFVNRPLAFVDAYGTDDVYPSELWASLAAYLESGPLDEMTFPGGRYACAQAFQRRELSFLEGYSLGQLCHIVQLAISDKKHLGYLNGSIVAYGRSQSMIKEQRALQHQALPLVNDEAAALPCATWEQAIACVRLILDATQAAGDQEGPAQVALSNVKRLFRSQFGLELSETFLGHSKLSELMQDHHFEDLCYVSLGRQGYSVIQCQQASSPGSFCPGEPLCLADAAEEDTPVFQPTPGPFGPSPLVDNQCLQTFGGYQPLSFEESDQRRDMPSFFCRTPEPFGETPGAFGATPGPFGTTPRSFGAALYQGSAAANQATIQQQEDPLAAAIAAAMQQQPLQDYLNLTPQRPQLPFIDTNARVPFCAQEPLCLDEMYNAMDEQCDETGAAYINTPHLDFGPSPAPAWSPVPAVATIAATAARSNNDSSLPVLPCFELWKDGQITQMVQRTFIHASESAPTDPLPGTLRRATSMGDLSSGSTSARSCSSSNASPVCDRSCERGDTEQLPKQTTLPCGMNGAVAARNHEVHSASGVGTYQMPNREGFAASCVVNRIPSFFGSSITYGTCPPPAPLPQVVRLSDHLARVPR
jgi:hypothetical protein